MNTIDQLIIDETIWLKSIDPKLVCIDASFVPSLIAKNLNIPSVLISNFTFDCTCF